MLCLACGLYGDLTWLIVPFNFSPIKAKLSWDWLTCLVMVTVHWNRLAIFDGTLLCPLDITWLNEPIPLWGQWKGLCWVYCRLLGNLCSLYIFQPFSLLTCQLMHLIGLTEDLLDVVLILMVWLVNCTACNNFHCFALSIFLQSLLTFNERSNCLALCWIFLSALLSCWRPHLLICVH